MDATNDIGINSRVDALIDDLTKRLARAELTLNRHGFKDNGGEAWDAPEPTMTPTLLALLDRAQSRVRCADEQRDMAVETATRAVDMLKEAAASGQPPRVYWPDPAKMNFSPDRRDPYSLQDRHVELRRRESDINGKDGGK